MNGRGLETEIYRKAIIAKEEGRQELFRYKLHSQRNEKTLDTGFMF
jgi:hypothetical protein